MSLSGFNRPSNWCSCRPLSSLRQEMTCILLMSHTKSGFGWPRNICMNDPLTSLIIIEGYERPPSYLSQWCSGVCNMAWTPLFFLLLHCTGKERNLHPDLQLREVIWQTDIFFPILSLQDIHNKFLYFQGLSPNLCWLSYPLPLPLWEPQPNSPAPWVMSTAPTPLHGTSNIQARLLSIWCFLGKMEATAKGMGSLNASLAPVLGLIAI